MGKNKIGLLNHEGEIFKVHRLKDGFKISDFHGEVIYEKVDAEFIMSIFEGKVMIKTSEGKGFDISKEPNEAKPNKDKLVNFLKNII
jgi:hypothetical protein